VQRLEFLIATGEDPMLGLQVKLDRECYSLTQKPAELCGNLDSQTIYSFEKEA
jgi:3,4-dihydroxy 2-butanone 4-phosphate synthase / GTP cyclohydrolase II